jgi:ABC-type transport system involved in multi-copper enzyme maturation permease subunit
MEKCGPSWNLANPEIAYDCGKKSGYIIGGVLSVIGIIMMYLSYSKELEAHKNNPENNKKPNTIIYIIIFVSMIGFSFFLLPLIAGYGGKFNYLRDKATIENLMARGMTRSQAIDRIIMANMAESAIHLTSTPDDRTSGILGLVANEAIRRY